MIDLTNKIDELIETVYSKYNIKNEYDRRYPTNVVEIRSIVLYILVYTIKVKRSVIADKMKMSYINTYYLLKWHNNRIETVDSYRVLFLEILKLLNLNIPIPERNIPTYEEIRVENIILKGKIEKINNIINL